MLNSVRTVLPTPPLGSFGFIQDKLDKTRQNQVFNLYSLAVFSGKLFHDVRQKKYYMFG